MTDSTPYATVAGDADRGAGRALRFRGAAAALSATDRQVLFDRAVSADEAIRSRTAEIVARVRREGDHALFALARELDEAPLDALEVPRQALHDALDALAPDLRRALDRAARNIASVHRAFLPHITETSPEPGIVVGRRPDPLRRVGVYAPGGRALYPSSVLMGAIPARVAGVAEVIVCSPPTRSGAPNEIILAAAALSGVDRVFAIGGAGAIAAMAYGTESVPRVDRIVGPGNAYVTEAKLQLTGVVGIDAPAGPSELLVIADETSDPSIVARELLAQAEHDPLACVVALVVGDESARAVEQALNAQLPCVERRTIVDHALHGQGAVLSVASLDEAIEVANRYAAEHVFLALAAERCAPVLRALRNAGTVFVGESASNAFGDYMTGANHVLPTRGLSRSYSGLSVLDFFRWTSYQRVDRAAAARLSSDVATFAEAEGLPGHARAARSWSDPTAAAARGTRAVASTAALQARREIATLPIYAEAREETSGARQQCDADTVDLSDNTNLWGTPPAALAALRDSAAMVARYPSPYSAELKRSLARYVGASEGGIVTGCGSDELLDATMRAFGAPGDSIAYSTPTFSMIPVFARVNGLVPIEIPLGDDRVTYDIDADRLVGTAAKLIYLCAPNNPTGTAISRDALEYVVDRAPGIVIIDEAYAEFASTSNVDLAARRDSVVVTRTFSKAFGLAGARVGYAVADPTVIGCIERARGPYRVSAPAERAALAALEDVPDGLGWVREHARLARHVRARFVASLRSLGMEPLPSEANFVLVPDPRAPDLAARLRGANIIVRAMRGLPETVGALDRSNGNALRIGIGPWPAMVRVLGALAEALR